MHALRSIVNCFSSLVLLFYRHSLISAIAPIQTFIFRDNSQAEEKMTELDLSTDEISEVIMQNELYPLYSPRQNGKILLVLKNGSQVCVNDDRASSNSRRVVCIDTMKGVLKW